MDAVDWSPWIDHENAELDKGMYESFVRVDPHLLSKDAEHLVRPFMVWWPQPSGTPNLTRLP
eukprot:scaffold3124_cov390-Prasinococcus_capsulatus_cf.AAC.9